MILDRLENADRYTGLGDAMSKAFRYLQQTPLKDREDGRHDIDASSYMLVQTYQTKDPGGALFEAHRKFIDIQLLLEGKELIGWASLDSLEPDGGYSEDSDAEMFRGDSPAAVVLEPGWFAVFMPEDGHRPCCHWGEQSSVRKVVVKVPVR